MNPFIQATESAIQRGLDFLTSIQEDNGSWRGDYGGPLFLLPMYVGTCYITGQKISQKKRQGMIAYFRAVQNADGSIGLHAEDTGFMFTTVLSYTALRFLGVARDDPSAIKMRAWILSHGTAVGASSWGKFFLALLNLYPHEGLNPILPELWQLPYAVPFHPGRLWCHARQVYLPMAYLYGIKAKIRENDLIREIREDIYKQPYDKIKFHHHRDSIAVSDNYTPQTGLLKVAHRLLLLYERWHLPALRKKSLATVFDHIRYEDMVTNYINIGPINSILNTLVHYFRGTNGNAFQKSFTALKQYLWEEHDVTTMNGYLSTAVWDTVFAVQSIVATPFRQDCEESLLKAYAYIRNNQICDELPDYSRYFRHASRGGWPFSNREHGWPTTDCTSEAFKAALALKDIAQQPISDKLLKDSIDLILSLQNRDGGWATYEKCRGGWWFELLNPSNVFSDIMIDYSYVECSSACVQALVKAREHFSHRFGHRLNHAIERGVQFIKKKQRTDGSWEGSWGVCFTYGTWFGVWGLIAAGVPAHAPEIQRACRFLIEHQNKDGGWGESYLSCRERRWRNHCESHVVNTSWVLMTLIRAQQDSSRAARKAAEFLIKKQLENGDWPRQSMVGIFNKTTLINYENYRRYFPIWALGLYCGSLSRTNTS